MLNKAVCRQCYVRRFREDGCTTDESLRMVEKQFEFIWKHGHVSCYTEPSDWTAGVFMNDEPPNSRCPYTAEHAVSQE